MFDCVVNFVYYVYMRKYKIILFVTVIFLLSASLLSCQSEKTEKITKPKNIILITLDTTRPDLLGCYGGNTVKTPNLDSFSEDAVIFENANSQIPSTGPSHASMFTGKYPFEHGVIRNAKLLPKSERLLNEILKKEDFETAAFIAAYPLTRQFGFSQGFDTFNQRGVTGEDRGYGFGRYIYQMDDLYRSSKQVNRDVFKWLAEDRDSPFYLWVHYFDPHKPYSPRPPFDRMYKNVTLSDLDLNHRNQNFLPKIRAHIGEVSYMDKQFGKLIQKLKQRGLYEDSLIAVLSDHGEGLGEHRWMTHIFNVYEEAINIVFMIKFPEAANGGKRILNLIETLDYPQTVLDILNLSELQDSHGKSLLPLIYNRVDEIHKEIFGMRKFYTRVVRGSTGPKYFVETNEWKYIQPGRESEKKELYNLVQDPEEQTNLKGYSDYTEKYRTLQKKLEAYLEKNSKDFKLEEFDKKTREKLKALGYLN